MRILELKLRGRQVFFFFFFVALSFGLLLSLPLTFCFLFCQPHQPHQPQPPLPPPPPLNKKGNMVFKGKKSDAMRINAALGLGMGENIIDTGNKGGKKGGKKGKKGGEGFGLTERDLKKLKRAGRIACYENGEMICCQGVQVIV